MNSLLRNTLLMKSGEKGHAWLRVVVSLVGVCIIAIMELSSRGGFLSDRATTVYISYTVLSLLVLMKIYLSLSYQKLWRILSLILDTVALTLISCCYYDFPFVLLAVFALPLLGHGLCCGRYSLVWAMFLILVVSAILVFINPEIVSIHSTLSALGVIFIVSLFSLFMNAWSKDFKRAKEEAEKAKHARSIFFANMSHELRTPLHGILGLSTLLKETDLEGIQKRYSRQISDVANTMLSLVDNALDFACIEENKLKITRARTDLHLLIFKIYRMFYYKATEKRIFLYFRIDPRLSYSGLLDQKHTTQVIINLVANAIKFTDSGFVSIEVTKNFDGRLKFTVLDSGRGVSEKQRAYIFERYTQVYDDELLNNECSKGTGLGLTISKQLVEAMGGSIGLNSQYRKGSSFWFELPYQECFNHNRKVLRGCQILTCGNPGNLSRIVGIAKAYGASVEHLSDSPEVITNHAVKGSNVVIFGDGVSQDFMKNRPSLGRQEGLVIIELRSRLADDLDLLSSHSTQYYSVSIDCNESWIVNLLHGALVCQMDYEDNNDAINISKYEGIGLGCRVLVAEDNDINREVISQILRAAGYKLTIASSGSEALKHLSNDIFDLFIVDNQMPGLSGLETVRQFRKQCTTSDMAIIVVSADISLRTKECFYKEGIYKYLCKPVGVEKLLKTLSMINIPSYKSKFELDRFSTLNIFDMDNVLDIERSTNKQGYARRLTIRCLTQVKQSITEFSISMLSKNDPKKAAQIAHYIKGTLGMIGAVRLSAIFGMLDKKKKILLINDNRYIINLLRIEYKELLSAVKQWLHCNEKTVN